MNHSDFKIGDPFMCGMRKYLCTDIGTRTIVAIQITYVENDKSSFSWLKGPPYALSETVFDENDIPACKVIS